LFARRRETFAGRAWLWQRGRTKSRAQPSLRNRPCDRLGGSPQRGQGRPAGVAAGAV